MNFKQHKRYFYFVIIFIASMFICKSYAQNQTVSAVLIGNRIDVTIGDKFFTSYRLYDDEKHPFFFPVNGPISGGSVRII